MKKWDFKGGAVSKILIFCTPPVNSSEHVTRDEIFSLVYILTVHTSDELANIPEEILLEDAFASNAEFRAECIQARFGGVGLPPTIEDCHGGVINHCNLVAVEIDSGHTVVGNNRRVTRSPVLVCLDSSVHLGFDLTHLVLCLFDSHSMPHLQTNCKWGGATT